MCQLNSLYPAMTQIAQISSTMGVQIYNIGVGSSSSPVQNLVKSHAFENVGRVPGLSCTEENNAS